MTGPKNPNVITIYVVETFLYIEEIEKTTNVFTMSIDKRKMEKWHHQNRNDADRNYNATDRKRIYLNGLGR